MGYGTVLIVRRQARNSDGDRTGPPADTAFPGWRIAPVTSTETDTGARDTTIDRLQAYGGPQEVDIRPDDTVFLEHEDRTGRPLWQVVGNPEDWVTPSWFAGRVVTLQRVRG